MRKSILAALAIAAVVIVAAGAFLTSRIRAVSADLAQRVERETGVKVTSSGLPGISFWPRFSVSFSNVVIPAPQGGPSTPLATIDTLRVVPSDGFSGMGSIGIAELVLERPNISLVVDGQGRANWNYAAKARIGDPPGLPLRIEGGRIAFLDERTGAAAEIGNVEAQAQLAGAADALDAKGAFIWNERRAAFTLFLKSPQRVAEDGSPADMTIAAPGLTFQFSGRAALSKGFELDGQAEIKGTDLGLAASWFGAVLPPGLNEARFQLAGAVETTAFGLAFSDAQFMLDDMRGEGDVSLAQQNGRPKLDVKAEVKTIDLTRYKGVATSAGTNFLAMPWSSRRIDLSALRTLDANFDVTTNAFAYGAFRTGPAQLKASVRDGSLDLKLDKASYADGTLDLALLINGKASLPSLKLSANGEGLVADKALLAALGFGNLTGRLSPSFSITASGTTLAEIISTLKGEASFRTVEGAINSVDLPDAFAKVTTAILDGWDRDERQSTPFDALSATFIIADGIATTSNLILSSPHLSFTGKGEVDLLRQAFDLKVDPQIPLSTSTDAAPQFVTFPVPIQVHGQWTKPKIYPDMPGILEDPAAAYAALKKLGLGTSD